MKESGNTSAEYNDQRRSKQRKTTSRRIGEEKIIQYSSTSNPLYFFLAAFSADFVTGRRQIRKGKEMAKRKRKHTLARRLLGLVDGLDDADSDGLPHVTDGEPTERGVLVVGLDTLDTG
jgi:molecular chaperone GrpE (heat shock protein)